MMACISLSVGVLNFLPIPILDGDMVLLYLVEAIRRRPLSQRARDRQHRRAGVRDAAVRRPPERHRAIRPN